MLSNALIDPTSSPRYLTVLASLELLTANAAQKVANALKAKEVLVVVPDVVGLALRVVLELAA
jgi:hypothetical protein